MGGAARKMNRIAIQRALGRRIRKVRRDMGLTEQAFARLCKVKALKIWRLEGGRVNPTLATLARIARALETTIEELFKGIQ